MSQVVEEDRCVSATKKRLASYGFGDMPGINKASLRRRRLIATFIVLTIVLCAELAAYFVKRDTSEGTITRLTYAFIELPILILSLTFASDFSLRRRYGPLQTIALSSAVAALVGAFSMSAMFVLGKAIPSTGKVFECGMHQQLSYFQLVVFGMLIAQIHQAIWALAYVYPFAAHDARLRALEAEKLRSAAELARLKSHLEPHFLLNTLNAIAGLVTEDPREARRLIACLGDLLRDGLREGDEMSTLGEEEAWLRRYAEILESRHRGMLSFDWEIDPRVKGAPMPRLLLQPLLENAVKHGALRRRSDGRVLLRAFPTPGSHESEGAVTCIVEDNGPGFGDGPLRDGALGLKVVKRRLELKYKHANFRIETAAGVTQAIVDFASPRPTSSAAVRALTGEPIVAG